MERNLHVPTKAGKPIINDKWRHPYPDMACGTSSIVPQSRSPLHSDVPA
jgi:hypothetical protein